MFFKHIMLFINFSIEDIDIERGDDNSCNHDYLEIPPAKKLCGFNRKPSPYIINSRHATLYFQSDKYNARRGFLLKYISGESFICQV